MKKLICTQCGAGINNKTLTCEYCGSVFLSSNNAETETKKNKKKADVELQFDVRELDDQELATLCKASAINTTAGNIFVIMFMFLWTGVAFSIFMSSFVGLIVELDDFFALPFLLVPGAFVVIGVSVIVKLFTGIFKGSITKELILIRKGEHEKARLSLMERENKKHNANFVATIILIDYFKLANYSEAKKMIIQMSQTELSSLINKSNVFLEISQNLGVRTPNFANVYGSYGNNGFSINL